MRVIRDFHRLALRQPGFVALVVLTLGVGIGATTAAVNVGSSILLSPLPLSDESRLVLITKMLPHGNTLIPFTPAEMAAWAEGTRTLASVGGVQYDGAWPWTAELGALPATLVGAMVSGNFFAVLGAEPAAGRLLADDDTWAGAEPVAVIAHGLWQRQFGRDPTVAGRRIRLNGKDATIVGVAPAGFSYPKGTEVWQPLADSPDDRQEGWFNLVARLRPDASITLAAEEAATLLERLHADARAGAPRDVRAAVVPLKEAIVGDARPVLALFGGAAILVLIVGCLNVGNMLLVRATARTREIAVRAALGASPSRLAGDLAAEAAVLGIGGAVLGILIAFWLQRALVSAAPADLSRLDQLRFGIEVAGARCRWRS
jgi:putative ABC transport system permease protein